MYSHGEEIVGRKLGRRTALRSVDPNSCDYCPCGKYAPKDSAASCMDCDCGTFPGASVCCSGGNVKGFMSSEL